MRVRPKPFTPEPFSDVPYFVRDTTGGSVWHRCQTRPLYADTDCSQVVYHANYLRYFELGRATLMRHAAYPYREVEADGFLYPIIKVDLDYYCPLHYDEPIFIYTRPGLLERVKLQFDYVITHRFTGALICKGFTRHCAVNQKGIPVEVDPKTVKLWRVFPR